MKVRRGVIALVALVLVATLAGCNLPVSKAGAKCSPVGKAAQDKTYILSCGTNHRYKRTITIATANALVNAYIKAHTPPPPPPPPPAPPTTLAPPMTTFGQGTYTVGTMPADVAAGTYTANAGTAACGWSRTDATGPSAGYNSFTGVDFMQILPTDNAVSVSGPCTWTLAPSSAVAIPSSGDATYRVGIEAPVGWYHFSGGPNCYWEVDSALTGADSAIEEVGGSTGPDLLSLDAGDASIQLRGCGTLSARAEPTRLLLLTGIGTDPILGPGVLSPTGSNWTGYDQTDTTITATLNPAGTILTVTGAGWTITVSSPNGQTLPTGATSTTYSPVTMDVTGTAATAGLSFGGNGHSCTSVGGTSSAGVARLAADSSGNVTALSLLFVQHCNGLTFGSVGAVTI